MKKIVINDCWGGFGLSEEALARYNELNKTNLTSYYDIERDDPNLIQVIAELGEEANGRYSKLKVVSVPDDINWQIDEYDGMESVHEVHRSWC